MLRAAAIPVTRFQHLYRSEAHNFRPLGIQASALQVYVECLVSVILYRNNIIRQEPDFTVSVELHPHISVCIHDADTAVLELHGGKSVLYVKHHEILRRCGNGLALSQPPESALPVLKRFQFF